MPLSGSDALWCTALHKYTKVHGDCPKEDIVAGTVPTKW